MWVRLKFAVIILSLVIAAGTFGFWMIEDNIATLLDSFFFVLVTVTTVGYGDVTPQTSPGKIMGIVVILLGVGSTLVIIQTVFGTIVRKEIKEELKLAERFFEKTGHFIVCGYGMVGRAVVRNLQQEEKLFVVIENDAAKITELVEAQIPVIEGDAREEDVLEHAGIKTAGCLLTTLDDSYNAFIALTARILNPDLKIVSKIEKLVNETKLRKAGADQVIACHDVGAKTMIQLAQER